MISISVMDGIPNKETIMTISPSIEEAQYAEIVKKNQPLMQKENIFTDIKLKCGDITFPAHKVILATHSPYFRAMFTAGMKESSKEEVELQGEEPAAILRILEYIYSGEVDVSSDTVALLGAAELLQIDIVSKLCCSYLLQTVSSNQFHSLWNTMDMYGKTEMVNMIVDYLASAFMVVSDSQEFLKLTFERFLKILESSKLSVHPETILSGILKWVNVDYSAREDNFGKLLSFVKFSSLSTAFLVDMIENEPLLLKSPSLSQKVNAGLSVMLWKRTKVIALIKIISPLELELCCLNLKEHCQYYKLVVKPDFALSCVLKICSNKNTIILITETHVITFNLETRRWSLFPAILEVSQDVNITCAVSSDCIYLYAEQTMKKFDFSLVTNQWQAVSFPFPDAVVSTLIDVDGILYAINPDLNVVRYNKTTDKWSAGEVHDLPSTVVHHINDDHVLLSALCGEKIYLFLSDPEGSAPFTLFLANQNMKILMERKLPSVNVNSKIKCFNITEGGGKYTIHLIDTHGKWWSLEEENNMWRKNGVYVPAPNSSTDALALPEHNFAFCNCANRNVNAWEYDVISGVWFPETSFIRSSQISYVNNMQRNNMLSWNTGMDHVDHGIIAEAHID